MGGRPLRGRAAVPLVLSILRPDTCSHARPLRLHCPLITPDTCLPSRRASRALPSFFPREGESDALRRNVAAPKHVKAAVRCADGSDEGLSVHGPGNQYAQFSCRTGSQFRTWRRCSQSDIARKPHWEKCNWCRRRLLSTTRPRLPCFLTNADGAPSVTHEDPRRISLRRLRLIGCHDCTSSGKPLASPPHDCHRMPPRLDTQRVRGRDNATECSWAVLRL